MKTIEERALEYANELGIDSNTDYFDYCKQDYIAGATEQKLIDDAELLKSTQGNSGTILEKLREYLSTSSQEDLDAKYNELSEFLSTEHATAVSDKVDYQQGYHDAIEKAILWFQLRSVHPISRLEDSFRNFMEE